jgi:hypothetical protein
LTCGATILDLIYEPAHHLQPKWSPFGAAARGCLAPDRASSISGLGELPGKSNKCPAQTPVSTRCLDQMVEEHDRSPEKSGR